MILLTTAFLLDVIINSFIGFFLTAFLIGFVLRLCRGYHPRIASFCYAIPFLKLPLDATSYCFQTWSLAHGINPYLSEPNTRLLSVYVAPHGWTGFGLSMGDGSTFALGDLIALTMSQTAMLIFLVSCAAASISIWTRRWLQLRREALELDAILGSSRKLERPIPDSRLRAEIELRQVTICHSTLAKAPFTTGLRRPAIVLPAHLAQSCRDSEYQAILAHELAHLRWLDPSIRLALHLIRALFWWIPMGRLIRRVMEFQEQASDHSACKTSSQRLALASAIQQSARLRGSILAVPLVSECYALARIRRLTRGAATTHRVAAAIALLIAMWLVPARLGLF